MDFFGKQNYYLYEYRDRRRSSQRKLRLQRYQTIVYNFLERPSFRIRIRGQWKAQIAGVYQILRYVFSIF